MKVNIMKLTDVQENWLQALESDEYPQNTDGYLKTDVGFCCLGVACKQILGDSLVYSDDYSGMSIFVYEYQNSISAAPPEVVEKLGLYDEFGCRNPEYDRVSDRVSDRLLSDRDIREHRLSTFNDEGMPFNQIAAKIRENPEMYLRDMSND